MREQVIALEHHADLLADGGQILCGLHVLSLEQDLSALDLLQGIDTAKQGRLAAAGGPQKDHDLALCDVKADVVEDVHLSVIGFCEMLYG